MSSYHQIHCRKCNIIENGARILTKNEILRNEGEKKDFWDKHKDSQSKFSSHVSNFNEFGHDECRFHEENLEIDNAREDKKQEELGETNKV